ncbi:MAG: thymidine phosphorylase [Candidatus Cloacimonetes bacterium]|jgi:pyrimidine-nucleoside phosphorylase|nr:thymidine phosphorylase [Candidatus Cloacimonadota bacterium]
MTPYEVIRRKRDGGELSSDELRAFLDGYARGSIEEYQMAAFLMAVFFVGLTDAELATLVDVMLRSGVVVDLSDVPGTKVDKHSTGGVGDKVSLVLAPLVASLGVPVPMMSGRGLGHTGGTVDKLETIPGFRMELGLDEYRAQMERIGCALIAASPEIAPLDRRLYALRDVTGTVESIPLIASSIMSKKLAEGIDALVLDVKVGNGAFMDDEARARQLARTMIAIGRAHDRTVVARLTAMDRPLGHSIGNALEVEEAIAALHGGGPADLREVTVALAAEMLMLGGRADSLEDGAARARTALDEGRALDKMREVIEAQGGNPSVLDDPAILPQADVQLVFEAPQEGTILAMDTRAIGVAAVELGAGRATLGARIDPSAGFHLTAKPGDRVERGQPLATIHARTNALAEQAARRLQAAIRIGEGDATPLPLLGERITG